MIHIGFPGGSVVKNPPANAGDMGLIPGSGRSWRRNWQLTQAREVSWTEEPGRLQSMGSQRVGHNLATPHHTHTHAYDCCSVTKSPLTLCDPVDCQPPLSMGFSRQEYWSGLPFPYPGELPNPGIEPGSLPLQVISCIIVGCFTS